MMRQVTPKMCHWMQTLGHISSPQESQRLCITDTNVQIAVEITDRESVFVCYSLSCRVSEVTNNVSTQINVTS